MKGQKTCRFCGNIAGGPRTRICKSCGKELIASMKYKGNCDSKDIQQSMKNDDGTVDSPPTKRLPGRPKKEKFNPDDFDWHTLEKGDIIKVSQMDGSTWELKTGETIPMGDGGNFKVLSHDANGIHAWALGKKSGHHYIWMGAETQTDSGIIRKPHKILKLKKFIKEDDD
jgi:hypothetical protein